MRKRTAAALLALALLCVGTTELTASYFFAPELFDRVTAPVVHAATVCADAARKTYTGAKERIYATKENVSAYLQSLAASLQDDDTPDQLAQEDSLYTSDTLLTDPTLTELRTIDGTDYLTGGIMELVYYNQTSPDWAELPYGTDDIARYGCGPTTMAMVVSSMTGQKIEPPEMASWAASTGHWAKQSGSYLTIVKDAAQAHGLTAYSIADHTPDAITTALLNGDLIVALMGPGHFTRSGHFILIHGVTLSGTLLVADPNSLERSLTEWDAQLLIDELSKSTTGGAPLWGISSPPES